MNINSERVKNKAIHILSRGIVIDKNNVLLCKSRNLEQNFYFLPDGHIEHKEKASCEGVRKIV